MSQHAKWSQSAPIDRPVDEFLRSALATQLHAVARLLRAAARKSERDREYVHRLRVATRRAQAILDLAGDFLPTKSSERARRMLRKIRLRAGAARDLDVQLERLVRQSIPTSADVRVRLSHRTALLRGQAQVKLERLAERWGRQRLRSDFEELVSELAWRSDGLCPDLSRYGARTVSLALVRFDESQRFWAADLAALHRIRVAGKMLRYTLEVFAPLFQAEAFDAFYQQLVELQDALGELHDSSVSLTCWEAWATLYPRTAEETGAPSTDAGESTQIVDWPALIKGQREKLDSQIAQSLEYWPLARIQRLSAAIRAAIADIASP